MTQLRRAPRLTTSCSFFPGVCRDGSGQLPSDALRSPPPPQQADLRAVSRDLSGPPHLPPASPESCPSVSGARVLRTIVWCVFNLLVVLVAPSRRVKPVSAASGFSSALSFSLFPHCGAALSDPEVSRAGSAGCPRLPCVPVGPGGLSFSDAGQGRGWRACHRAHHLRDAGVPWLSPGPTPRLSASVRELRARKTQKLDCSGLDGCFLLLLLFFFQIGYFKKNVFLFLNSINIECIISLRGGGQGVPLHTTPRAPSIRCLLNARPRPPSPHAPLHPPPGPCLFPRVESVLRLVSLLISSYLIFPSHLLQSCLLLSHIRVRSCNCLSLTD